MYLSYTDLVGISSVDQMYSCYYLNKIVGISVYLVIKNHSVIVFRSHFLPQPIISYPL